MNEALVRLRINEAMIVVCIWHDPTTVSTGPANQTVLQEFGQLEAYINALEANEGINVTVARVFIEDAPYTYEEQQARISENVQRRKHA